MFKLILYTSHKKKLIEEILKVADRKNYIQHIFYRKSLIRLKDKQVKNLRIVEPDLSKVLAVDVSSDEYLHKDNCLLISSYVQYNKQDRELKTLIEFFKEKIKVEDESLDLKEVAHTYNKRVSS